jgi:NhaP-type Na+/H+ or K+/H+ antiporter
LPAPEVSSPDVVYVVAGVGLLAAAVLPRVVAGRSVSTAMAFVGVGLLVGLLPIPLPDVDPVGDRETAERLTEVTVIVALMGVGLAIDRPFRWRRWSTTWRLLGIGMPLSIAVMAVLGWGVMGLSLAGALLLAAVLAPTDPVLASDVQVAGPNEGGEDEVRFGLTSEAGLNDGLAFPFVYLAVFVATVPAVGEWGPRWIAWELVGKVAIGVLVGAAVGWLVARIAFRARGPALRLAEEGDAVIAVAVILLSYGMAEAVQGYGFLAVFAAAVVVRSYERSHEYHTVLHSFVEQIERMLTSALLLIFGLACAQGLLADLTWTGALVGVLFILVVRPLTGRLALIGGRGTGRERWALAFFGVRGIGSFYYLAYASGEADFPGLEAVWSAVAFTVLLSVVVHGVTATPAMRRIDLAAGREAEAAEGSGVGDVTSGPAIGSPDR